ncbi:MAG: type II toxin-antitoxin system RelE/ParE family toxin, partial [Nannocystaceae bacterium]
EFEFELEEAADWYAKHNKKLASRLLMKVEKTSQRIEANPAAWPEIAAGIRQLPVEGFPYAVIYAKQPNRLLLLSLAHQSRKPRGWENRLRNEKRPRRP